MRQEGADDRTAVYRVNRAAFGREAEARLVDALRESDAFIPALSLVAVEASGVIGHILFTRLRVTDEGTSRPALALAPMAVLPAFQNRGVGSALVLQGLDEARRLGHSAVIVVGHPHFYPRFGFQPAQAMGLRPPFDVPADAFLALGLQAGALNDIKGLVEYPPEFAQV